MIRSIGAIVRNHMRLPAFRYAGLDPYIAYPHRAASRRIGLAIGIRDPCGPSCDGRGASLNAIFLGIIGEYVGRIYNQVRQRPNTVIEYTINLDEPAALQPPQLSRSANA